jgi:CBS domain containing-hemolysin-like protein
MIATSFKAQDWALVAAVLVLLALSGVLAAAETSLIRTSKVKARALEDEGRHGARPLVRLVEHPERFLNPVLLLVLVCQLVSATFVGILAESLFGALGVLIATAFEVAVIFVLFEAVPKNWAVQNPERAALFSAPLVDGIVRFPPVRAVSSVLIGLANAIIRLGPGGVDDEVRAAVTESELLAMADVAQAEDVIAPREHQLIHSIIEFGDTVVREVMVPRPDMVSLDAGVSVTDALESALAAGYSRLPVYEHTVDDVVGIAYTKDLVRAEREGHGADPVRTRAREAMFVPETKALTALLRDMQDGKVHQAIVVDEYGGTAGLVTLEDVIEELVGEIVDEYDIDAPAVERPGDGSVVVAAGMAVDDASELLGADLPQGAWDTVGGLVLDVAGRVPAEGESVTVPGFVLVAEQVRKRRIGRVRILPQPDAAAAADAAADAAAGTEADAGRSGSRGARPVDRRVDSGRKETGATAAGESPSGPAPAAGRAEPSRPGGGAGVGGAGRAPRQA